MTQINVLKKHIEEGQARRCEDCPVALAILAAFPGSYVSVDGIRAYVWDSPEAYADDLAPPRAYNLNSTVAAKIDYFDVSGLMKPFSFELGEPV